MKRDDGAALLGFLVILLGVILATTAWWRTGIACVALGIGFAGLVNLRDLLLEGFSAAVGWTDEADDVE